MVRKLVIVVFLVCGVVFLDGGGVCQRNMSEFSFTNTAANDTYRAESSGDKKLAPTFCCVAPLGFLSAADVRKWAIEFLLALNIECRLNFMLR